MASIYFPYIYMYMCSLYIYYPCILYAFTMHFLYFPHVSPPWNRRIGKAPETAYMDHSRLFLVRPRDKALRLVNSSLTRVFFLRPDIKKHPALTRNK